MPINYYALNIKSIVEDLGSIKVTIDDDDLACTILKGLSEQYKQFNTSINTHIPWFKNLISMLLVEEKNMGLDLSF